MNYNRCNYLYAMRRSSKIFFIPERLDLLRVSAVGALGSWFVSEYARTIMLIRSQPFRHFLGAWSLQDE